MVKLIEGIGSAGNFDEDSVWHPPVWINLYAKKRIFRPTLYRWVCLKDRGSGCGESCYWTTDLDTVRFDANTHIHLDHPDTCVHCS